MTPQETIDVVRMLLDDSVNWYVPIREIVRCVNEAQRALIEAYHQTSDERALRPLYVTDYNVSDLGFTSAMIQYPRACRIAEQPIAFPRDNDYNSLCAEYIHSPLNFNIPLQTTDLAVAMPRNALWTYRYAVDPADGRFKSQITFSDGTPIAPKTTKVAIVTYIAVPPAFTYTGTPASDVPLTLPREYHLDVATLAAEYANDIDVGEYERGQIAIAGQGERLTLRKSGSVR